MLGKAFQIRKAEKNTTCSQCNKKIKEGEKYLACFAGYLKRVACCKCFDTLFLNKETK